MNEKAPSKYVDNQRLKFTEGQLKYIRGSHADAVQAGYLEKGQPLITKPAKLKDMDKCELFVPNGTKAWDTVPAV